MILAAWYHTILAFLFAAAALLLMVVILLQRGRGVGLAGAFGGTGGSATFGAKTGDFLTWITIIFAGLLLLFAIWLNFLFRPSAAGLDRPTPVVAPGPGAGDAAPAGTTQPSESGRAPIQTDDRSLASEAIFGESVA